MFKLTLTTYKSYKKKIEKAEQQIGRDLFPEEVAEELNIDIEDAKYLIDFMENGEIEDNIGEGDNYELILKRGILNNELRKLRIKRELRQKDVERLLELSQQSMSSYESCRRYPNKIDRKKLCKFFKVKEDILFPAWLKFIADELKNTKTEQIVEVGKLKLESDNILMLEAKNDNSNISEILEGKKIKELADKILTPREQKIIDMRFGFDGKGVKTLEEVGNEFGVNRERIRQIEAKALDKIREKLQKKE